MAVVILRTHEQGRHYRLPHDQDYQAVWKAMKQLEKGSFHNLPGSFSPIPDEPTPTGGGSGAGRAFSLRKYGMTSWADLFTARQKLALATLTEKFRHFKTNAPIQGIAALALSKFTELATANCPWEPLAECPRKIFNLQAIPTRWEFAEGVITSNSSGGVQVVIQNVISTLNAIASNWNIGQSGIADACALPIPDTISDVWFIDPPYYDAVPYSDLSGFFFVWLKRILPGHQLLCDPFDSTNPLTPKLREIIQDELKLVDNRPKDKSFFEKEMSRDFTEGRRILKDNGITCVVFAHKTTEGWEALLSGMIQAKWVITASWPIATEQQHRPRARNSAALATSIHLVCRPRPEDAPIGDWGNVLRELPRRVSYWMERLQEERVRGADLVFACIGPALEIFSRYSKVETAEGCEVTLAEYLEKVWEVVGRSALEQVLGTAEAQARNGIAGALEEDARLTALFLWTLQSTNGSLADVVSTDPSEEELDEDEDEEEEETTPRKPKGYTLIFDVVRRFAQPLGIHLPAWENRIIQTKKGVVRLLSVSDRAQQLFGRGGAHLLADQLESSPSLSDSPQLALFPEELVQPKKSRRGRKQIGLDMPDEPSQISREATTLDRVHAAMLLQANGRTNALRTLLNAEQDRGPDFLRLANALSALYAVGTEEKRLLDAMLLAVPR